MEVEDGWGEKEEERWRREEEKGREEDFIVGEGGTRLTLLLLWENVFFPKLSHGLLCV